MRNGSQMDDNNEIIKTASISYPFKGALESRLSVGVETYGHGVRVGDDTTQWGTKTDSWLEMGLEEIDDLAIYVIAQLLREAGANYTHELIEMDGCPDDLSSVAALTGVRVNYMRSTLKDLRDVRRKIMDLMNDA